MSLQLVDENALEAGERWPDGTRMVFTKEEFEQLDNKARRRIAAYAENPEINGKSPALLTQSYFVAQRTLTDYANK